MAQLGEILSVTLGAYLKGSLEMTIKIGEVIVTAAIRNIGNALKRTGKRTFLS
jgi:hypothetical protein